MSISEVGGLKSMKISLDSNKIQRHPIEPTGLELKLTEIEGVVQITLAVEPFKWQYGNIKQWDANVSTEPLKVPAHKYAEAAFKRRTDTIERYKKEARVVYEKVAEAIKKGDYVIHLSGNGEVKVDVKY
jgi:hypothetical protein